MSTENHPKIVTIHLPEYTIDRQPDYAAIGAKIDRAIADNFEGTFLLRSLSVTDHPQYDLEELADIITRTGTDKYDPNRKGVDHESFEPYKPDLQAGIVTVENGKIIGEPFAEDIRRFYENVLLDRGYRLRLDLLVLYDPKQMIQAEKIDDTEPGVDPHLEKYLWRFKYPEDKAKALAGLIMLLR
jgi:hypothetical protein